MSLAFLVLFSTVSFTVEKHFCGDTLIDSSVFFAAEKCDMEMSDSDSSPTLKKHCCKDIIEVIQGQDQLKINPIEDITYEHKVVLFSYLFSYKKHLETLPQFIIPHKEYSPPDITVDHCIRYELFLI